MPPSRRLDLTHFALAAFDAKRLAALASLGGVGVVRLLGAGLSFLASVLVARFLDKEHAGHFFLAISVCAFLGTIGMFGLGGAQLRFIGAAVGRGDMVAAKAIVRKSTVWCGLVLAALSAGWFFVSFIPSLSRDLAGCFRLMAPACFFFGLTQISSFQLQALGRPYLSIIFASVLPPAFFGVTAVSYGAHLELFYGLGWVASFAISRILIAYELKGLPLIDFESAALLKSCVPLFVVNIFNQLSFWGVQLVSSPWLEAKSLAELAVSQRVVGVVGILLAAVNMVLAPRFAALKEAGEIGSFRVLARRSVLLMGAAGVFAFISLVVLGRLILLAYGAEYVSAYVLLIILGIGQLFNAMTGSVGYVLAMSGNENALRKITVIMGSINLVLLFEMSRYFGAVGAACASAIVLCAQNFLSVWYVKRLLGFNTLSVWRGASAA